MTNNNCTSWAGRQPTSLMAEILEHISIAAFTNHSGRQYS